MKSIAIMQPTFMPWIGYFALIDRVDEFVFLDNVQFDKRSWQQRNKIKTPSGPIWLSVPVLSKGKAHQKIHDVEIMYEGSKSPLLKISKSIETNYKKAPFFSAFSPQIFKLFDNEISKLSELNMLIIQTVCDICNIPYHFLNASDLEANGQKDELLFNICKERQADIYVSPPGSANYLENSHCFGSGNINIFYHDYEHPSYNQLYGEFVPYMCILDLLFNEGADATKIIRSGMQK